MSQFKKTTNVKVAAGYSTGMNLSRNHYTTLNFGSIIPAYNLELCQGDRISIRPDVFARLAPMALPPFANIDLKLTAFFVPFRTVWKYWNEFLAGTPAFFPDGSSYVIPYVPTVSKNVLIEYFRNTENGLLEDSGENVSAEDIGRELSGEQLSGPISSAGYADVFIPTTSAGTFRAYRYTVKGKRVMHILHALGYNFNFTLGSTTPDTMEDEFYSALPLLCYFKAYVDWHVPSQLQPSNPLHKVLAEISQMTPTGGDMRGITLTVNMLDSLFSHLTDYYENDYFTSAWLNSNSPADGLNSYADQRNNLVSNALTQPYSSAGHGDRSTVRNSDGQVALDGDTFGVAEPNSGRVSNVLSYEGLTLLERFANFVRRNNFAGSRAVERILARFGVRVPDAVLDYSEFVGQWSTPLRITDVTAQGSDLQTLGDYAGKGIIAGNNAPTWSYDCEQQGMFFVFAAINPNTTFLDGIRHELFHLSPTDYYTPEFDGTLLQAISGSELVGKQTLMTPEMIQKLTAMGLGYNQIFGFIQRYAEYKRSLDDISGDFDVRTLGASLDGFLMNRRLLKLGFRSDGTSIPEFVRYDGQSTDEVFSPIDSLSGLDAVQYNRLFKDTTGRADPFFIMFHFDVSAQRKMLAANDTAELFGRGGNHEMNTNGVRV